MKLVVIESPYGSNVDGSRADAKTIARNVEYLRAAISDCLRKGEAPFASHGLYTQPGVLKDSDPDERKLGMDAGFSWHRVCDYVVVYMDHGVTLGMRRGMHNALLHGKLWLPRFLYEVRCVSEECDWRADHKGHALPTPDGPCCPKCTCAVREVSR